MSYLVTCPLVITKKEDGSDLYLYQDAELPESISADEAKRLVSLGMVTEVADPPADEDGNTPARSRKKPAAESN